MKRLIITTLLAVTVFASSFAAAPKKLILLYLQILMQNLKKPHMYHGV